MNYVFFGTSGTLGKKWFFALIFPGLFAFAPAMHAQGANYSSNSGGTAPLTPVYSPFTGFVDSNFGVYPMGGMGFSRTAGSESLGASIRHACGEDNIFMQGDVGYSALQPGGGGGGTNAWYGDTYVGTMLDSNPVGVFGGVFRNRGQDTWGGGIAGIKKFDNFALEGEFGGAHTSQSGTNMIGANFDFRYYPLPSVRLDGDFGLEHTSTSYRYYSSDYTIPTFGFRAETQLCPSWSVYGGYDYTHFSGGSYANEFSIGVRYSFGGGTLKDRDEGAPSFNDFTRILGVNYKF